MGECVSPKSNVILHALECKKVCESAIDTARKVICKWNRYPFFLPRLIRKRRNIYGCEMFAQFLCSESFIWEAFRIYERMIGKIIGFMINYRCSWPFIMIFMWKKGWCELSCNECLSPLDNMWEKKAVTEKLSAIIMMWWLRRRFL